MEFKVYEIPNNVQSGIYILINDDEVVYVGKTENGLRRIMQHNDKFFNKYSFIEAPREELDYYEDMYIMKFQPKYNNFYSYYRVSVESAYRQLRYVVKKNMNIEEFKEFILNKNIEIKKFKNYLTITKDDFYYLKEILEESWS